MGLKGAKPINWYAVHVRSQFERRVRDGLAAAGFEPYLPLYRERTRWSDRRQIAERVLFPGYVFSRFRQEERRRVIEVPGIVRILGAGQDLLPIADVEMDRVRRVVESGVCVAPLAYLVPGQRVRVQSGPLAGVEGVTIRLKGELHVVVAIEMLGRSVAAVLSTDSVVAMHPKQAA